MSDTHSEKDLEEKDVSYSPASDTETAAKQEDGGESPRDDVRVRPGTGGPDDVGEVDVDPDELRPPGGAFPGHA